MSLAPLTSELLDAPRLRHGFFTRAGGVSEGIYASLNAGFGSKDDPAAVAENRDRVAKYLGATGGSQVVTGHQVHSKAVEIVTAPWVPGSAPQVDGLVTKQPGLVLGVLSADCAPILFADDEAGVIGACHAGWRGAIGGVAQATVEAMVAQGAKRARIHAVIGPCIGPESYEVSDEFVGTFMDADPDNMEFFEPGSRDGHALFDLGGYLLHRLEKLRIGAAELLGEDTLADPSRFFSYRRETLANGGAPADYGRLISAIALAV
ncbi:MAG: peptidoglycan editing factor PgeF [Elstera sp.]